MFLFLNASMRMHKLQASTNEGWPEWKGLWSLKQVVSSSNPCGCSKLPWERSPPLVLDSTSED